MPGEHADVGNEDPGNGAGDGHLEVLCQSATAAEPGEGALDDPAAGAGPRSPWLLRCA